MKRSCLAAGLLFLLSGCTTQSTTAERDALADLGGNAEQFSYQHLSLALILSKNTREGMRMAVSRKTCMAGWNPKEWFGESIERLRKNFKKVVIVDDLPSAARSGADLIAVLDDTAVNSCIGVTLDLKLSAVFLNMEQKQIDAVAGENVKGNSKHNPAWWNYASKGSGRLFGPGDIDQAIQEAQDNFEAAVKSSRKLGAFSQARPEAAPAVAASAPAATAPAPALHSDVDIPGYQRPDRPHDFALVVGIGKYKSLPEAKFAERDAEAVRAHLAALGLSPRNIISLIGDNATHSRLQSYLEEWLPRNVGPESTLFVYYSGHGAPDVKTGQAYLVPWDGDPKFLNSSAYSTKRLFASLAKLPAKRVVVALDSCFSGAGGRSVLPDGARPLVTKVDEGFESRGNLTLFSAAAGDEITSALDEQGHGIFTYFFLKGLKEGKATSRALFEYLKPKVQEEARRQNREQSPGFNGSDAAF